MSAWQETFRSHVIIFERYLADSSSSIPPEQCIYLAGMAARLQDRNWLDTIQPYLLESPEEMKAKIRKHEPYIGQNAPVFFVARINGEFLTLQIISAETASDLPESETPRSYFLIAAQYADRAGQNQLATIYRFIGYRYEEITKALAGYFNYLDYANGGVLPLSIPDSLWQRAAEAGNERNQKKERWEKMGLDPARKTHIPRSEFNCMIDFQSKN